MKHSLTRCAWCGTDPIYVDYHDNEWGIPLHDDQKLFELLILEGAQAGLSWITILRKRDNYRRAFANFDPELISQFDDADKARLHADPGIVRNRLKIEAAVVNAQAYLALKEKKGAFSTYLWQFVEGRPIQNTWQTQNEVPAQTPQSDAMSKDLRLHGFKFVGSTICYAFMQAAGLVNDHLITCFRHQK